MLDLVLAIVHHVLVFGIFGLLFAELMLVRAGMEAGAVRRVARLDAGYGATAGLIIAVGFSRAVFAAKGWVYYSHNALFWAKIGAFALVGLLSIAPTLAYLRWRKQGGSPDAAEVAKARRWLWLEVLLFPFILAFAAAMARGYGEMLP
jgi:putative membrane protein